MIYQLKITLKGSKPPIWRRVQVDASMTFAQLHRLIQTVMAWEDAHLHEFTCTKIPKHKRQSEGEPQLDLFSFGQRAVHRERAHIGDPQSGLGMWPMDMSLYFDEGKETVSEWLTQEKDKCLYTYDFGDDWQHEIVLEKMLSPEDGVRYPVCIKARQTAPGEDSLGFEEDDLPAPKSDAEILKEVNEALNKQTGLTNKLTSPSSRAKTKRQSGSTSPSRRTVLPSEQTELGLGKTGWETLFDATVAFKKLAPWQWMYNSDLFAVYDAQTDFTGYCTVMGNGGEVYGLAVYAGDQGLHSLLSLFEEECIDDTYLYEKNALLLSFDHRQDLDKRDYQLIKDLGLRFRGKHAWPVFRRYRPGLHPWYLTEEEVGLMTRVLDQAIDICQRTQKGEIPSLEATLEEEGHFFARISEVKQGQITWEDGWIHAEPESNVDDQEAYDLTVNELELKKRSKELKTGNWHVFFDFCYLPHPVRDEKDEVPYHPRIGLWMEQESGILLHFDMCEIGKSVSVFQTSMLDVLENVGSKPQTVIVQKLDVYKMLLPLCDKLCIQLELVDEIPDMEEVKEGLLNMMGS